jgi:hypothetical protein
MSSHETASLRQPSRAAATRVQSAHIAQPGDHVRVWRGLYWHHAICVGNDQLIEFGSGIFGGVAAFVDWQTFSKGSRVELVDSGGRIAAERAVSRLGMTGFDLISRNCEHFATWCVTGRWESSQVRVIAATALSAAAIALVAKAAPRLV